MEYSKTDNATNETEIIEMLGVNAGMRVDLQSVVIMRRVFKEATTISLFNQARNNL